MDLQVFPSGIVPFIQVIDSFDSNRKLGIGFEASVCGGKLLVLAMDVKKDIDKRPAAQQLLRSIDKYVRGDGFAPRTVVDIEELQSLNE